MTRGWLRCQDTRVGWLLLMQLLDKYVGTWYLVGWRVAVYSYKSFDLSGVI